MYLIQKPNNKGSIQMGKREEMADFKLLSEVCRDKCKEYFKSRLQLEMFVTRNPNYRSQMGAINQIANKIFINFDKYLEGLDDRQT